MSVIKQIIFGIVFILSCELSAQQSNDIFMPNNFNKIGVMLSKNISSSPQRISSLTNYTFSTTNKFLYKIDKTIHTLKILKGAERSS